jgi:DNA polymerase, archaea type
VPASRRCAGRAGRLPRHRHRAPRPRAPHDEYLAVREQRHELSYEAVLAAGRTTWRTGERYRVYRTRSGGGALSVEDSDPRDYDADHYVRLLRDTYASRLVRAFAPEDFAAVFADPDQLSLFTRSLATIVPVLTPIVADPPPAYSDFH